MDAITVERALEIAERLGAPSDPYRAPGLLTEEERGAIRKLREVALAAGKWFAENERVLRRVGAL